MLKVVRLAHLVQKGGRCPRTISCVAVTCCALFLSSLPLLLSSCLPLSLPLPSFSSALLSELGVFLAGSGVPGLGRHALHPAVHTVMCDGVRIPAAEVGAALL